LIGLTIQNLLDFEIKVNENTGEQLIGEKKSAHIKNLHFTITPGGRFVKFQGSLHKYANGGERNNDRFTFERFLKVYDELKEYISPDDQINVLEFGVNIQLSFSPALFIKNIIAHRDKQFNKTMMQGIEFSQIEYNHFRIKIYNKGLQQGPEGTNILRVEVKYNKMQKLFPEGLKWSDLANLDTWEYLGKEIRKKFNDIIFYDPSIDLKQVPAKERIIIVNGNNPRFWENQTGPHVSRKRKQYQSLIKKYGIMFNNISELLDQEIKEVVKSYHYSDKRNEKIISSDFDEVVKCYPLLYGNFSPITENTSSSKVFCKITGIDISMQKPGSKFLCISGLRWLFMTDRKRYNELKSERLSEKWSEENLSVQFREICHSIRNEYHNPKNNTKRSYSRIINDPVLFDNWQLIREDKKELILLNNKITNRYCNGTKTGND
jgi:hypothetical protein